eukprot:TRINITY_DN2713_c0_g1_i11.p1 TRINITY_DN2713_c0_g1~~TRINITY_DN2713_c0_g1_i11.p1  ORF type:complete len:198 (-),score=5.63 TRINITY_DN2713_c0_g1_i11:254-847(-)
MAGDLEQWWRSLAPVTKYLFAGTFVLTLAAHFRLINSMYLILDWNSVYRKFEIWRLVTCFLFQGRLGFHFLINLMFLIQYGTSIERGNFEGIADYLTFILFCALVLLIPGFLIPLPILGTALILSIIYYWFVLHNLLIFFIVPHSCPFVPFSLLFLKKGTQKSKPRYDFFFRVSFQVDVFPLGVDRISDPSWWISSL